MNRTLLFTAIAAMSIALVASTQAGPPVSKFYPTRKSAALGYEYAPPSLQAPQPQPYLLRPAPLPVNPTITLGFHGHFHDGEGMHVDRVNYGTLAQQFGLEPGDVIVRINNQRLECEHDYFDALRDPHRIRLLVRCVRTGRLKWTRTIDVGHNGPMPMYGQAPVYSSRPF
jgi:hypothetical protein